MYIYIYTHINNYKAGPTEVQPAFPRPLLERPRHDLGLLEQFGVRGSGKHRGDLWPRCP